jgi:hypothetical protein
MSCGHGPGRDGRVASRCRVACRLSIAAPHQEAKGEHPLDKAFCEGSMRAAAPNATTRHLFAATRWWSGMNSNPRYRWSTCQFAGGNNERDASFEAIAKESNGL